jgi:hypothetical protein
MKKEIIDLFEKCVNLKENEFLYTIFGPENYYKIQRVDNTNNFTISQFGHRWLFQKDGKVLGSYDFSTIERLNYLIFSVNCIPWYATNVFSRNLTHLDNWVNFVKAFKVATLVEDGDYYINRII